MTARRSRTRRLAAWTAALLIAAGSVARAEVIDRVLAVVNGEIVTLSDVRAALRFGLVPADVSTDPIAAALQRLIERRLMLTEVDRYAPPEPPDSDIDAALQQIAAPFKDALEFETALTTFGLSREDLRRFVRDRLRIESYLQQRFASVAEPAEDELRRFYQNHPDAFTRDGTVRPFDAVRADVRTEVIAERRQSLIRDWIEALRRRGSVVVLYLPETRGGEEAGRTASTRISGPH